MIGTSQEMLYYFTYDDDAWAKANLPENIKGKIRYRVSQNSFNEDDAEKLLRRLGCRMIRPEIIVPALVRDKHNRIFTETTFDRHYFSKKVKDYITKQTGLTVFRHGGVLIPRVRKIFYRSVYAHLEVERTVLPSVWIYEPFDLQCGSIARAVRSMLDKSDAIHKVEKYMN